MKTRSSRAACRRSFLGRARARRARARALSGARARAEIEAMIAIEAMTNQSDQRVVIAQSKYKRWHTKAIEAIETMTKQSGQRCFR